MNKRQKAFRWALLIISGFACLLVFFPFLMEILVAAFFAFALSPIMQRLISHKFFGRKGWVAVTILGLVLAIVIPIILMGVSTYNLVTDFSSDNFRNSEFYKDVIRSRLVITEGINSLLDSFNIQKRFSLNSMIDQFLRSTGGKVVAVSGVLASRIPDFVLSLFIFCCALYLFLAEGRKLRFLLSHNQFIPAPDLDRLIKIFQNSCYTTLVASVIVGLIQASIVAVGSALLKAEHVMLIFLVTLIFSFIPVLGAAPVAFFMGIVSFIKGDTGIALGYLVVGLIAGTTDNVIRPWLVRGDGNIHPVVMLIAIIGAIMLFGIPGLFLGPMFVSVAVQTFLLFFFNESDDPKERHEPVTVMNDL